MHTRALSVVKDLVLCSLFASQQLFSYANHDGKCNRNFIFRTNFSANPNCI